ncbi:ribosomal protein S10 [Tieghemostelium lacteum]|uniref:Ribosomal protein S10 n=1 Tax=Tieghemostelium lacteum TaxID=361077 RepID=A0A152A5T1_TIELA|nr:ribosomal protein S10 [Tieghemostelium lacteum]|eukprot:KYR01583.1 ribosomal protein S10 [Tieghemostelium lacteum]
MSNLISTIVSNGRKVVSFQLQGIDRTLPYIAKRISWAAKLSGIKTTGPYPLPSESKKWTINKSPHTDKRSRDQYEIRISKRLVQIDAPIETADKFVKFVQTKMPPISSSVDIKIEERIYIPIQTNYSGKKIA